MRQVGSLLSFYWIILIKLGPCSLRFAEFLESTLVSLLLIKLRVLVYLFIFVLEGSVDLLKLFRIAKSSVEHSLVVPNQSHFSGESLVPVVL